MVDHTPLSIDQSASQVPPPADPMMNRTRSQEMVDDPRLMMMDEDPLLISQTLTFVTDEMLLTFQQAPFSFSFKARFIVLEIVFVLLLVVAIPIGAHGTVVAVSIGNLMAVAWFWYNFVRAVEVTSDGTLRFWIGNIELDVPFDKIVSMRSIAKTSNPCNPFSAMYPYRGFLSNPNDGVAIVTTVPSTPFWLWPRSAGKPERSWCFGMLWCPKLTVVFSPQGGSHNFIQEVENEMRNFSNGNNRNQRGGAGAQSNGGAVLGNHPDFLDV